MAIETTTTTSVTPSVVTCHQCQQPVPQADAWSVRLIVPSGIYRNGREMWRATGETAYLCKPCTFKEEEETA